MFKQTFPLTIRTSERPFLVTEDFTIQETVIRKRTTVDHYEGFAISVTRSMYLARNDFLASTRVSSDKHGHFRF